VPGQVSTRNSPTSSDGDLLQLLLTAIRTKFGSLAHFGTAPVKNRNVGWGRVQMTRREVRRQEPVSSRPQNDARSGVRLAWSRDGREGDSRRPMVPRS
jgi:hypothetical protein